MSAAYSDNATLLKSLSDKDPQAFAYIYNLSRKRLFIIAYTIVQDIEVAKDIVQDFFADFLQHPSFENVEFLQKYMSQSVRNKAFNLKKRQQTFTLIKQNYSEKNGFVQPEFKNQELKKELKRAMDALPPMASKVFTMHYIEDLSYSEISHSLGITKSTISSHMDRALKGLRSALKKNS